MSTIKATNIQPQSDSDPLVFSTNATERMRIPSSGAVSITGGIVVSGGKVTSEGTTGSDSASTLTTKSYVDSIFNPQLGTESGGYTRIGNFVMQFGAMPLSSMTLDTTNNHFRSLTFPIPYTSGPWSIQVTPRYTSYVANGDIVGQAAAPSLTGFTVVLNGASSGVITGLTGAYRFAIGTVG